MIKVALVCSLLVSGVWASAQTTTVKKPKKSVLSKLVSRSSKGQSSSSMKAPTMAVQEAPETNQFSVGLVLTSGNQLSGLNMNWEGKHGQYSTSTSGGLGFMGEYKYQITPEVAFAPSLTLQSSKDLGHMNGTIEGKNGSFALPSQPSFEPVILATNGEYHFNDMFYGAAGVNTTVLNFIHLGSMDYMAMNPELGYQLGGGMNFSRNFAAELLFQSLRYRMEAHIADFHWDGYVVMDGVNLQGRYTF